MTALARYLSSFPREHLDLALTRLPHSGDPPNSDLNVKILSDDEVVVAAGIRSRWARRRKLRLADLAEAQWILTPEGSIAPKLFAEAFGHDQLKAPKVIVTSFSVT